MTEAHADRAHATLAPSSAHRWLHCPGSVRLSRGLQEAPSTFAAEGTAAHELAEKCLKGGFDAKRFRNTKIGAFTVDPEMVESVQLYLDTVYAIKAESDEFETEQRMDMSEIVPGVFGTGDVIAYREDLRRVTIVDLKYGRGVGVAVKENEQLLTYALGVAQRFHNRGINEVELVVVQPRAPRAGDDPPGVRRWPTDILGLYEHAIALQAAAIAAEDPNAPLVTGPHCKFCKAAAICPAIEKEVEDFMSMGDPANYSPEQLAAALAKLPMVMTRCKAVEQFAHSEAVYGRLPPGWKLVAKRATRKWVDEDAAVKTLRVIGLTDDEIYETKLASPAAVEPLMPGKNKTERGKALEGLTKKESSGTSLAPLDDARPAVDPDSASGFEAVTIADAT